MFAAATALPGNTDLWTTFAQVIAALFLAAVFESRTVRDADDPWQRVAYLHKELAKAVEQNSLAKDVDRLLMAFQSELPATRRHDVATRLVGVVGPLLLPGMLAALVMLWTESDEFSAVALGLCWASVIGGTSGLLLAVFLRAHVSRSEKKLKAKLSKATIEELKHFHDERA